MKSKTVFIEAPMVNAGKGYYQKRCKIVDGEEFNKQIGLQLNIHAKSNYKLFSLELVKSSEFGIHGRDFEYTEGALLIFKLQET